MTIPVGAAVRSNVTGKLGRKVKVARYNRRRGHEPILFDGDDAWWSVPAALLTYVARKYETAKVWEKGANR
jgi:hypothetical protein